MYNMYMYVQMKNVQRKKRHGVSPAFAMIEKKKDMSNKKLVQHLLAMQKVLGLIPTISKKLKYLQ
jgi:hypothetical protein